MVLIIIQEDEVGKSLGGWFKAFQCLVAMGRDREDLQGICDRR